MPSALNFLFLYILLYPKEKVYMWNQYYDDDDDDDDDDALLKIRVDQACTTKNKVAFA